MVLGLGLGPVGIFFMRLRVIRCRSELFLAQSVEMYGGGFERGGNAGLGRGGGGIDGGILLGISCVGGISRRNRVPDHSAPASNSKEQYDNLPTPDIQTTPSPSSSTKNTYPTYTKPKLSNTLDKILNYYST